MLHTKFQTPVRKIREVRGNSARCQIRYLKMPPIIIIIKFNGAWSLIEVMLQLTNAPFYVITTETFARMTKDVEMTADPENWGKCRPAFYRCGYHVNELYRQASLLPARRPFFLHEDASSPNPWLIFSN